MKTEDIKKMAQAWNSVQEASYGKKKEAMDPVDAKELKGKHKDRKDKDIDNDGDVDKSDEYLHKRRKAVSKAIKGKETETEVQTQESVELDEATTKYVIKHKKTKQVLSTHDNYEDAKDEHSGLGPDKANHGIYKQTKKDSALANRNTYREEVEELDELSKKTLGSYVKKADKQANKAADSYSNAAMRRSDFAPDTPAMAKNAKKFAKRDAGADLARKKLAKEAKDHGNMNNGSPRGEGLSPSAKKELDRTTPMNPATDEPMVNKKTFDAIRASGKKAPMRSNDNAQGDKTAPKTGK